MSGKPKIAVLLTTYNRCDMTVRCIKSLYENNENIDFRFVVVDDNSSDDTVAELLKLPVRIKVMNGDGQLYWNGGMRMAMSFALRSAEKLQYVLLVNDDVVFEKNAINKLVERMSLSGADVIVGATSDDNGNMSYGGVMKTSNVFAKFKMLEPSEEYIQCDTFNCNCVLMTGKAFKEAGTLDKYYKHSMGDYDYGMHIRKLGMTVISSSQYVGHCNDNKADGSWRDTSLTRKERLELKEGTKGLPFKDWFYFVKKNYGVLPALYHSITPYVRIMLKK